MWHIIWIRIIIYWQSNPHIHNSTVHPLTNPMPTIFKSSIQWSVSVKWTGTGSFIGRGHLGLWYEVRNLACIFANRRWESPYMEFLLSLSRPIRKFLRAISWVVDCAKVDYLRVSCTCFLQPLFPGKHGQLPGQTFVLVLLLTLLKDGGGWIRKSALVWFMQKKIIWRPTSLV